MKLIQRIKKLIQQLNQNNSDKSTKKMIFSTSQQHLASLLVEKLRANNIEAVTLNQKDSMHNAFGLIEIYVKPEDVVKAKYIIDKDNE